MRSVALLSPKVFRRCSCFWVVFRALSNRTFDCSDVGKGFGRIDDFLNESWKNSNSVDNVEEKTSSLCDSLDSSGAESNSGQHYMWNNSARHRFLDEVKNDSERILDILHQDGLSFDAEMVLSDLQVRVSDLLVREVLNAILKSITPSNKNSCAKLGYKFFLWSGEQESYTHAASVYNIMMAIFAKCDELKAMWGLADEMIEKGYPATARTFNILICTSGGAGLARKVVERFIKSKKFSFRPFKHSFNAILHSLLILNQYKLIEWAYQIMLVEGYTPDVTTYNIVMYAKFRLGKLDQFHRLLGEMSRCGFLPNLHTFNLLLHVFGKGDKPLAALSLLNHMKEVGVDPNVLHFTTLMDGLCRAGNLDASEYFFNEMTKHGCVPDVVCYTVMITGYIVAGEFDKAQGMFSEMIDKGQLPNVFTYNSMIRGLCMIKKFDEAWLMLKEMESRGCNPNFFVYTTLVSYLRNAGKLSQAHQVIRHMVKRGRYAHLETKIRRYRKTLGR